MPGEQDWQSIFHYVLPDFDGLPESLTRAEALTKFRAQCQIALGKWMYARELERQFSGEDSDANS